MQRIFEDRAFSLIGALLVVLIISMTIAVIGSVFLKSREISHAVRTFKTTSEAAEATAQVVIQEIDNGTLSTNCTTVGCDSSDTRCEIDLPSDIEESIRQSSNIEDVKAYLLKNCTSGSYNIYTVEVEATAKDGSKTTVFFIYQK
jgi:uncharacterized protein (UPF0333 family)